MLTSPGADLDRVRAGLAMQQVLLSAITVTANPSASPPKPDCGTESWMIAVVMSMRPVAIQAAPASAPTAARTFVLRWRCFGL